MKTLLSYLSYIEKRKKSREKHFQWLLSEPTTVCKKVSLTPGQESLLGWFRVNCLQTIPHPYFWSWLLWNFKSQRQGYSVGFTTCPSPGSLNHSLDTYGCKVCEGKQAWRKPGREPWRGAALSPMFKSKSSSKVCLFTSFICLVHGCFIYRTNVYPGDGVRCDYDLICDFCLLQLACSPKNKKASARLTYMFLAVVSINVCLFLSCFKASSKYQCLL